jgi:hypothetical protein
MKTVIGTLGAVFAAVLSVSFALANPALLPKHPGYPASGNANDTGQTNMGGAKALEEAAAFDDKHSVQNLTDSNNQRLVEKQGAGQLPKVQGPQIKIEPPVKEATRMKQ